MEIERCGDSAFNSELAPLTQRLRQEPDAEVFHLLFQFAAHSQNTGPAAPAAWLLRRLNPKCPVACRKAVSEMLQDWDVSIEEVPFYLAEQFGSDAVREAVAGLRLEKTCESEISSLDTINYWLGCYDGMIRS